MVRMLVTRPEPDASETAARLRALAIEPVVEPLLHLMPLPASLPGPEGFAALAATSANALRALHERGEIPRLRHLPLYAVGDRTAAAARDFGFDEVVSAGGNFGDLVALLARHAPAGPVLHPAARDQAGDLGKALAPHGIMVITRPVYAMEPAAAIAPATLARLGDGGIAGALFYSRRTAQTFVELAAPGLPRPARARLGMLCLSEAVAAPLLAAHFVRASLADHPSEEAMMALALSFARGQNPA